MRGGLFDRRRVHTSRRRAEPSALLTPPLRSLPASGRAPRPSSACACNVDARGVILGMEYLGREQLSGANQDGASPRRICG